MGEKELDRRPLVVSYDTGNTLAPEEGTMTDIGRIAAALAALTLAASSAFAQTGCWYSPPAVAYTWPTMSSPRVLPVPDAPRASAAPQIITARATTDASASPAKDRVKVGFWNITGRDITLTVAGKTHQLARNRSLTLELERDFTWQADRAAAHMERAPDGQTRHEVVIRD
jgi:hypothetical protein